MPMLKVVGTKIKTVSKESAKKDSKMCLKCGKVLDLDKVCNCEQRTEGKTSDDERAAN